MNERSVDRDNRRVKYPKHGIPTNFDDPTSIEFHTVLWRKFMRVAPTETIELTYFDERKKPVVAYARSQKEHIRLLSEADRREGISGIYTLFNELHQGIYARIGEGKWTRFASRASDNDMTTIRAVYLDFDAKRPRDISSTRAEKSAVYEAFDACRTMLVRELGVGAIGTGDSGNGYSIFIAIDPVTPSKETRARTDRFLKAMAAKFSGQWVDVDTSVSNPARLCPAFGTWKRKGIDCEDRPHRLTSFCCPHTVEPISLESFT